jgi:threonine dehydratase
MTQQTSPTGAGGPTVFVGEHAPDVLEAAARIKERVLRTPCLRPLSMEGIVVKPESLQATGSFKVRGAFNAVLRLLEQDPEVPGVVTVSSGNHGQALAYAAREMGLPAVVVMPASSPTVKSDAVLSLGARVVSDGVTVENREERFVEVLEETGFVPVHPFDDWNVIHGQATVGLEIFEQVPEASAIAVPVGGGGLISGIAIALQMRGSTARLVGVEPAGADDARRSLAAGQVVGHVGSSIADGALSTRIGERPAKVLLRERLVDEIVTVSDDELLETLPAIWSGTRLVVEPTGALALTACLLGRVQRGDGPMLAVVTGGNVDRRFVASTILGSSD